MGGAAWRVGRTLGGATGRVLASAGEAGPADINLSTQPKRSMQYYVCLVIWNMFYFPQ